MRVTWLTPFYDAWWERWGEPPNGRKMGRNLYRFKGSMKAITAWRDTLQNWKGEKPDEAKFSAWFARTFPARLDALADRISREKERDVKMGKREDAEWLRGLIGTD